MFPPFAGWPARARADAHADGVPSSLEKPQQVGLPQIRHGRVLLTRLKPSEIIESGLLAHFYEVVRNFI